jgi:hypothetical protein
MEMEEHNIVYVYTGRSYNSLCNTSTPSDRPRIKDDDSIESIEESGWNAQRFDFLERSADSLPVIIGVVGS